MQPSSVRQSERQTQSRVIALFRNELDDDYLGDWTDESADNSNIEEGCLPSMAWNRPRIREKNTMSKTPAKPGKPEDHLVVFQEKAIRRTWHNEEW